MEYILKAPEMTVYFMLLAFLPMYLSTPIWIRVSRRIGKKRSWLAGMCGASLGFFGLFFLGEGNVVYLCVLAVVIGTSFGGGSVVSHSIQADVVDYEIRPPPRPWNSARSRRRVAVQRIELAMIVPTMSET